MIEQYAINTSRSAQVMAAFVPARKRVFKETKDTQPRHIGKYDYMPWGNGDRIPYDVMEMIESDETMNTCLQHNIRVCYGAGLTADSSAAEEQERHAVRFFLNRNRPATYWMGVCTDIKTWGWAVSVITMSKDGTHIVGISRREAMYCRLAPVDERGNVPYLIYGNFRQSSLAEKDVEVLPVLRQDDPLGDLEGRFARTEWAKAEGRKPTTQRKFAVITRTTTPDSTYYPIPYYASLFKGRWYDIKQLIALAKYSKLKNSAPLKYIIEIEDGYWEKRFAAAGISSPQEQKAEVTRVKKELVDFLTGAENSGKAVFAGFFVDPASGHEIHEIKITNLETQKEGGDWKTDIQEAINMICFAMGVHSNLVGSVPGQSNGTSGSDKRELYTIAQCMEKPVHDILLEAVRTVFCFNGWLLTDIRSGILQLTTLDEHKDVKTSRL